MSGTGNSSPLQAAAALIARDLKLAVREGSALGSALGFFLVVVSMLPLVLLFEGSILLSALLERRSARARADGDDTDLT